MLLESEDSFPSAPEPPPGINLDRPIDDKGHSAMHWAAAMGDIDVVRDLIRRNARIDCLSNNLETPLMRAVMFTNNFDKQTMTALAHILAPTVQRTDWFGSTVFHHIAATTSSKNKYKSARYYIDTLVNVLAETWIPDEITRLLNATDQNGDTCVMIAARNGARKCVRSLLGRSVQVDRPNHAGETADELIRDLNARRRQHLTKAGGRELSSSPFAPDGRGLNGDIDRLPLLSHHTHDNALIPSGSSYREPNYRSATANSIITRLVPSFTDKLTQLARAFETEHEAKVDERVEIERVLRKRTGELEYLRKTLEDLLPLEEELDSARGLDEEARLDAEIFALEREAEAYLEMEHSSQLRELIAMGPPPTNGSTSTSSPPSSPTELAERLEAAQHERRALVKTIVSAMGSAGMGERQEGYKRLIRSAIGVRESEIEGMLDEVLRELEEEARERGTGGGMGYEGGVGSAMITA
jgi:hypothetical protein